MRISDWSSDVCSSDLSETVNAPTWRVYLGDAEAGIEIGAGWTRCGSRGIYLALQIDDPLFAAPISANLLDRKSVESGKSVSVRVDLGGRSIMQNKLTWSYYNTILPP